VVIVGNRGRLLADSDGPDEIGTDFRSPGRPEIDAALNGGLFSEVRDSVDLGHDIVATAVPILDDGAQIGVVRLTQDVQGVNDNVRNITIGLLAIGLAALIAGLVLAYGLAGSISRPLTRLAGTTKRLGGGDLSARAEDVGGSTEVEDLGQSFDEMADRLERTVRAQREFVANASHQLRTPLTGLRLRLEAASYRATDPELERELAEAEREVDRLANLLGVLLTLAQEGGARPAPSPVSISAAATAALDRWAQQAARDGRELVAAGAEDVWVAASEDDVATILDALVDNALRYSPAGGTVTIEWAPGELAVADEGAGLSPGEEEQVFERFRRGAAGAAGPKGTGLGLAIVRALAERWGGSVSMANRPERGARAVVRLPASPALPGEAPTEVLAR
jgi:signal transduction histidine kinase